MNIKKQQVLNEKKGAPLSARKCINCQEPLVFVPDRKPRAAGHIYSEAGRREVDMSGLCEWCFDDICAEPNELPEDAAHPMPGNVLMEIDLQDSYADESDRIETEDLAKATVVTSKKVDNPNHRPVIDIDLPIKVVESSTPGHHHLYIDHEMKWDDYVELLEVMVKVGLVQPGYVSASKDRGFTAVRLPWVHKDS